MAVNMAVNGEVSAHVPPPSGRGRQPEEEEEEEEKKEPISSDAGARHFDFLKAPVIIFID